MKMIRGVARPMIAGMFVYGGLDAARHPESKAAKAEPVITPIAAELGASSEPTVWVRVNGVAQVSAGLTLALGKLPRLSAVVLAGSLVPTTLAGHRFWEEDDPAKRSAQTIQFLKNVSMLGGLLLAAVDTEGRPSISWRVRRAADRTREATSAVHLPLDADAHRRLPFA
jgi:putative oxidoreductase